MYRKVYLAIHWLECHLLKPRVECTVSYLFEYKVVDIRMSKNLRANTAQKSCNVAI